MSAAALFYVVDAAGDLVTEADDAVTASHLLRRIPRARAFYRTAGHQLLGRKQLPTELACPHPGNGFGDRGRK